MARAETEEAATIEVQAKDEMVNQALDLAMNALLTENQDLTDVDLESLAVDKAKDILV